MKRIKLTQDKIALVSDIDYTYLNQWKWCYHQGYAVRNSKHTTILMHRLILERQGFKNFKQGDHINRRRLDNRRTNLRIATISQNAHNQKRPKNNTSGYKGVSWNTKDKIWRAQIGINGKVIYLGSYHSKLKAAKIYNIAAKKYHKKYARLNHREPS